LSTNPYGSAGADELLKNSIKQIGCTTESRGKEIRWRTRRGGRPKKSKNDQNARTDGNQIVKKWSLLLK
jgi:hypothetical protein